MNGRQGFTLIELLVVIAIIAILAGIIFPVFARAKASAYRSSDMSNMDAVRTALQLYRSDQGAYPPALLGYATQYLEPNYGGPNPTVGDVIPANLIAGALYPKRVDSLQTMRPAYDRGAGTGLELQFDKAVWPNGVLGGSAGNALQRYGPSDGPVKRCYTDGNGVRSVVDNFYYTISGYDAASVPTPGGGTRNELRYTLFWTGWSVAQDPCNPDPNTESGSASDDTRQLGYTDPPETTVITWDSFFRDYTDGQPQHGKQDIVLFSAGNARPYDSVDLSSKAWAAKP